MSTELKTYIVPALFVVRANSIDEANEKASDARKLATLEVICALDEGIETFEIAHNPDEEIPYSISDAKQLAVGP